MEEKKNNLIPNSTQIPNVILDFILPRIPEAEARCLLYICRRTFGFQRYSDFIGLGQFENGLTERRAGRKLDYGTGLNRTSIIRALSVLELAGIITVRRARKRSGGVNNYQINLTLNPETAIPLLEEKRKKLDSEKWRKIPTQPRLFNKSSIPTDTSIPSDTTTSVPTDTSSSVPGDTHKTKGNSEKQSIRGSSDPPKADDYEQVISFWEEYLPKIRNVPAMVTKADRSNLGRVMKGYGIAPETLEQAMLYFLAHYKNIGPSLKTMLSTGILSMLLNDMQNNRDFWKNLDSYADHYMRPKVQIENQKSIIADMQQLCARLKINS